MDQIDTQQVIELLIDYFGTGNKETDAVAKLILQSSPDYTSTWQNDIQRIQKGIDWTGIRAVEADIILFALQQLLDNRKED